MKYPVLLTFMPFLACQAARLHTWYLTSSLPSWSVRLSRLSEWIESACLSLFGQSSHLTLRRPTNWMLLGSTKLQRKKLLGFLICTHHLPRIHLPLHLLQTLQVSLCKSCLLDFLFIGEWRAPLFDRRLNHITR